MDTTILVILAAVVAVAAIGAVLLLQARRSKDLKRRFGPEYERAVGETGARRRAEHELHEREKRVKTFDIRPLPPGEAQAAVRTWRTVQAEFVDSPQSAISRADDLITDIMSARGYPVSSFEQRAADLSVEHGPLVADYRIAHEIAGRHARGEASTEDLRRAMIKYRELFEELVGAPDVEHRRAS